MGPHGFKRDMGIESATDGPVGERAKGGVCHDRRSVREHHLGRTDRSEHIWSRRLSRRNRGRMDDVAGANHDGNASSTVRTGAARAGASIARRLQPAVIP